MSLELGDDLVALKVHQRRRHCVVGVRDADEAGAVDPQRPDTCWDLEVGQDRAAGVEDPQPPLRVRRDDPAVGQEAHGVVLKRHAAQESAAPSLQRFCERSWRRGRAEL